MAKKKRKLKTFGMDFFTKGFFATLFAMMGFAIIGAGIRGQEATAPIVITIGMLMNVIGVAPFVMPFLYDYLVPSEPSSTQ